MADEKKGVLDDIPVIYNQQTDVTTPPIDSQHTTVENVLRLLIKDKYTPDTFKNAKGWQGVVMREVVNPKNFEYSTRTEVDKLKGPSYVPKKYKVFLLNGPGLIFERPKTYDGTSEDTKIIDALDDYTTSPMFNGTLAVGSNIWISNENYRDRVIEYSFSPTVDKSVAQAPTPASAGAINQTNTPAPSAAFKSPTLPKSGPVTLGKIPDDIIEDEAWSEGKRLGVIKLKTIVSYSGQRIRQDAADKFNALCEAAAKENIKIIAVSGFRQQQFQIELYNNRYEKKYPVGPKNNTLTPDGLRIGVAAYPGYSNHQSGIAVDIDVGEHKNEKDRYAGNMGKDVRYLWLAAHAKEYGFDNVEGKSVNEPWHWVYKGVPPATQETANKQKDSTY